MMDRSAVIPFMPARRSASAPALGLRVRPEIILDLSRLLSRVLHATPTGVDRVEMAYARGLIERAAGRLSFAAVHPVGVYGRLPERAVRAFLDATEARWEERGDIGPAELRRQALIHLAALWPRRGPQSSSSTRVYVQASPHHLEDERRTAAILARERARFVCLVHDLIPIEHPEYARPSGERRHLARIATILRHGHAIIANSEATRSALRPWLQAADRKPLVRVAHLGAPAAPARAARCEGRPCFVCVSTIEPRKNHLLLLNIWRRLVDEQGRRAPRLVLIGRRGWENENVIDMLDRCPRLRVHVEEHGGLPDRKVREWLQGASALLFPSFAEGYGMPVAEALGLGTPVICSDLPALREAGGEAPEYLDPLDGAAWLRAIRDYAAPDSPRRALQIERMAAWSPARWADHIDTVLDVAEEVVR